MFCPKCGEKNKDGANFCVKCGEEFKTKASKSKSNSASKNTAKVAKEVKEEKTEVTKEVKEKIEDAEKTVKITAEDVKELTKEVTKDMTNEATNIIRDFVAKPVDTLKEYGEEKRFSLSVCLVAIMSLLVGLFIIALIKNVYNGVMDGVGALFGSAAYGLGGNYGVTVPYFKIFVYTLLSTFALSFLFTGILYFVNSVIFKGKDSFKKIFVIYGIISMIASAALIASLVLIFINVSLATIVLALGLTLFSYYIYHLIKLIGPKDENKHGYIYVITTALFYVAVYVLVKVFM